MSGPDLITRTGFSRVQNTLKTTDILSIFEKGKSLIALFTALRRKNCKKCHLEQAALIGNHLYGANNLVSTIVNPILYSPQHSVSHLTEGTYLTLPK